MAERSVEFLLFIAPRILAAAPDAWSRGFLKSVIRNARNPEWQPSPRQVGVLRSLADQIYGPDEDYEVVE